MRGKEDMKKHISIYGAQVIAGTIYAALRGVGDVVVDCFIVSDREGNPHELDGIKVVTLSEYVKNKISGEVLIATPEEHQKTIAEELKKNGITEVIFLTSELRNRILRDYYHQQKLFPTLDSIDYGYKAVSDEDKKADITQKELQGKNEMLRIYMVRSSRDKRPEMPYATPGWISQIHAGAALDSEELGILRDDTGDSISVKNRDYCELTAMYWLWKNATEEYIGVCHYRRVFALEPQDIQAMIENGVEVVLPYPTVHFPNITSQYIRYLRKDEWELMQEAVGIITPEFKSSWTDIWDGQFFYNYNMLIAKRELFQNYCRWLFTVLSKVEELCKLRGLCTSKRYAGYMGEILTTLYFRHHAHNCYIIHTGVELLN